MTPTNDTIPTADGRTISLAELRAKAGAATPGPVTAAGANENQCWIVPNCFPRDVWIDVSGDERIAYADHIAAFDRETCLALVDEIQRLRERVAELEGIERTRLLAESNAYLEAGVRGTGKPTDVYPDWVYEARDAIRRQNDNPPHYLPELLAILGWQGGTYHQALRAVQRLVEDEKDREKKRGVA